MNNELAEDRRSVTSAENGKKSRGPKTAEGKRNSSRRATKHGLLAKHLLLDHESTARFYAIVTELHDEFQPQTPSESAAVDNMALCRWRQMRIWTYEHAAMRHEMTRQQQSQPCDDPAICGARAFRTLADQSGSLALLNRYETSYDRQYSRALRRLVAIREAKKVNSATEPNILIKTNNTPSENEPNENQF
jgi:hypothetical protein